MGFEAYWSELDWKALAAFAGVVGTIASPFLKDWWVHRSQGVESRAQIAETTATRLERINNAQFVRLEGERDHYANRIDVLAEAIQTAQYQARAMEDWAHWFRHGWCETVTKYARLSELFERLAKGNLAPESAAVIVAQVMGNQLAMPMAVPPLRDAAKTPPP